MLILLLFFCSGATALVYEVIWSKYLALMFGSTIQAQTVVLAVFMGGLALGNRLFGARADRSRQPLAIYGYVEVAIGLYAFFFNAIYRLADGIFVSLGAKILEQTALLLALKGTLSVALLLGPTILMGGTLPLLAAWLQKTSTDAGRRSARFYSTNSLGAVCGAGLAGFYLVQSWGMSASLQLTALINVLIGFTAIGLARMQGNLPTAARSEPAAKTSTATAPVETKPETAIFRWGCLLVALTGGVSMGLEVLASRCLTLIFGASLQAFAIVLMAFILGIGLGAAVIASPRRKHWPREITTVVLLLTAAGVIGLVVFNIEGLVEIYRHARSGLGRTEMGYRYHQIIAAAMAIVVLGLPAGALGAVLPLWIRVVSERAELLGERVGRLLTWNTLGAVGGVLLTGFVLMPTIGLRSSLGVLAVGLGLAASIIAWVSRKRPAALAAVAVMGGVAVVCATGGEGWRYVLSSGVFRKHETVVYRDAMKERKRQVKILYYQDAADATVSVEQGQSGEVCMRINGKVDASARGDLSTQYLLAHLPLMMRPDSREVFVFGMGSGITAGAVLGYPVEHVTVAENCLPVMRAARFFNPWNHGVLTDKRTRIFREDARTVLKLGHGKYDVIIAEPSNPWMVGVGSVFSREFYQMAAARLQDGGIMTQWFHVYEMHDGIVELVLRTFTSVFPCVEIWDASNGDLILLGSNRPWKSDLEVYRRALERQAPRSELAQIGLATPEAIWSRQLASQRTAFAIPGNGALQLDDFPVLEYEAPRAFYMGDPARRIFMFDERLQQSDLAPVEKIAALSPLPLDVLQAVFGHAYHSVNENLQSLLRARFTGSPAVLVRDGRPLPCLFATVTTPPASSTNSTNVFQNRLAEIESWLRAGPDRQWEGVQAMEKILTEPVPADETGWADDLTAVAVKTAWRLGRTADAETLLNRGLKREPQSIQLQYLERILARENPK